MSDAMIDTNVLIYLMSEEPDIATDPDEHEKWLESRHLLATLAQVDVSPIAWFEAAALPGADGIPIGTRMGQVGKVVHVDGVDIRVAERAAKLLYDVGTDRCPTCYSHVNDKPCASCKKQISVALRLNDLLIVAQADCREDVKKLYTYDKKMIKLDGVVRSTLSIEKPPAVPAGSRPVVKRRGYFEFDDDTAAPADAAGDVVAVPDLLDDDASEGLDEDAETDTAD